MERSKTILLVTDVYPPENAVVGRLAHEDAKALHAQGHRVEVFAAAQGISKLETIEVEGIRVHRTPRVSESPFWRFYLTLWNPWAQRDFKKVLAETKPNIVHFHNVHQYLSFQMLPIAKRFGARTLLSAHDVMLFHYGKLIEFIDPHHPVCQRRWDYRISAWKQLKHYRKRYNPLRRLLIRRSLRSLDELLAVSESVAQALRSNGIAGARVLYNGLDLLQWGSIPKMVESFKKKFALEDKKVVLFGGRLNWIKGGDQLLEAFRELSQREHAAVLLIAAHPSPYIDGLKKKATEWGMGGKVLCTGWLEKDELVAAFHTAEVIAVPSLCFESFSMMTLQAMAAGKPVIAACFGGPTELIVDGQSGYLVNPYDVLLLAGRFEEILCDASLRERLGAEARRRATQFSFDAHKEGLREAYRL